MIFAALLLAAALETPAPEPTFTPSPQQVLGLIRAKFRSHRPPPPYEQYTVERKQLTDQGYPDVVNSYVWHVWVRNSDRAAMKRKVFRDNYEYPPEFDRPAFNEPRDPGPPTADVFEPAPVKSHPVSQPYTPEPRESEPPVIGIIRVIIENDYRVSNLAVEGDLVHLSLVPIRDPDRNRLREIYADKTTYELKKLIATDKLFVEHDRTYGVAFTITMGVVDGYPVVTDIRGRVGDGYQGDGEIVDFFFRDIKFPPAMPDWYFNARQYGGHASDVPQ